MSEPSVGDGGWGPKVSLDDAPELAARLQAALGSGTPLRIDLEQAGEPSAAVVQVLLAAARAGDAFVLRRPSRAFVDGFSTLGLFPQLMAMPMEPAE